MKKIIVIEDDTDICTMLTNFLKNNHYEVCCANNGEEGVKLCQEYSPDLVLLDLMLPIMSGEHVLTRLRSFYTAPVIVLSAKSMVQSKINLLKAGADDYITKPFDLYELLARIEANLKRAGLSKKEKPEEITVSYKDITVKDNTVFIKNTEISFTCTELEILKLFLQYPKKIFSKQNLYETIWKESYAFDYDTINTHISNIRKKIKQITSDDYIETVWGIGYKLK